jgi:hypothetical protein
MVDSRAESPENAVVADRGITNPGSSDEHAALGTAAARRLFREGISGAEVGDPLTSAFARSAIAELARLQREEAPGSYREALEGAEASAEQFNIDPLQGVSEVVQNADDLGATTVRVALSGPAGVRDELLIVHDGSPVRLVDALSMVLPYLSTKRSSARAKGRFGIGLKTLVKLGARVSVHSAPYDFEIEANSISPSRERGRIAGFYGGTPGETLFAIPLGEGFDEEAFYQWFEDWDSPSLLFLDSVRHVVLFDLLSSSSTFDHRLEKTAIRHITPAIGDWRLNVQQVTISDPADGRSWSRYSVELPVPGNISRMHKATGSTTPVAAAFVAGSSEPRLFAGLPLRVPSDLPYDLHAQFDVDPSRGHVIPTLWNDWLLANLAGFLTAAALERFREDPRLGWFSVAVRPEVAGGDDEWLVTKVATFVDQVASGVCEHVRLQIGVHKCALSSLVYEEEQLDGLLSPADLERLVPGAVAVPPEIRDLEGRWRHVLDALGVSRAVSVKDALKLFDDAAQVGKTDEWCVRLMSFALDAALGPSLLAKLCLRFADGSVASPQAARRTLLVVEDAQGEPFGAAAGITKTLAPAYLGEDAAGIRAWLRAERVLQDAATPDRVLNAVAARGRTAPVDLDDDALLLLRDCLARIDPERRRAIGQRVGSAVRVKAYSWIRTGQQRKSREHPADCYLPSAIDRDPDSWARAAGRVPGPRWVDRTYAELLRTGGDRDRLAAQALFRLLGTEIAPRLRPARPDDSRYNDPATTIHLPSAPAAQIEALRSVAPRATHLQQDWESPDLDTVIADLASDKDRSARKARSASLITVLNRAWPRLYAGHERARAVHSEYSWQYDGMVPATWVARAASEPWLASQDGVLRPPRQLVLRTAANRSIYGADRSAYVHGLGEELTRAPAILWLGIKSNPRASVLLNELEALRDCGETGHANRVFSLYELLAGYIPPGEVSQRALVDDIDVATMRNRFGTASHGGGLILTRGGWVSPLDVLRGTPIFGSRRAFVPETPHLLPLWRALAIHTPTTRDALEVLREIAASPDDTDTGVLIDTYRFLAAEVKDLPQAQRRTIRSLPLWTGTQWTRKRPLYACEDRELADELSAAAPVWQPPCSLRTLGNLPAALHVTILDTAALPVAGVSAVDSVGSAPLRERARRTRASPRSPRRARSRPLPSKHSSLEPASYRGHCARPQSRRRSPASKSRPASRPTAGTSGKPAVDDLRRERGITRSVGRGRRRHCRAFQRRRHRQSRARLGSNVASRERRTAGPRTLTSRG